MTAPAANANNLGKINDLVLNKDGGIAAVVIGVGGFLGIGEKQVAVDFHALQWTVGRRQYPALRPHRPPRTS